MKRRKFNLENVDRNFVRSCGMVPARGVALYSPPPESDGKIFGTGNLKRPFVSLPNI